MELPLKAIVIIAVLVLVLVSLSFFVFNSSGESISRAEAERIFNTNCLAYSQRNCDWSATKEPGFENFLKACRVLYGPEREAFSCMYTYCTRCYETADLKCASTCNICSGHTSAAIDTKTCCAKYQAECSGSKFNCDVCSP